MNSLIVLGVALLALTTLSAPSSSFRKLSDFFREAEEIQDEIAKKEKKSAALVRMIQDAVAAVGLDNTQDLTQLLKEAKNLPAGFFGKLKSQGAKNAAAELGKKVKSVEERLRKEIEELKDSDEPSDKEQLASLTKVANKVKEAASKFQFLGEGKIVYIPSKYNGELAV